MADYRQYQISQMANVETYLESELSAEQILEFGFEHVAIATGSNWRRDGVARFHITPIDIDDGMPLFTPDDLIDGKLPTGDVVLFDDDHFYMGGVLAELLVKAGNSVTLVTPSAFVSEWTQNTLEQATIHKKLAEMGVNIQLNRAVTKIGRGGVETECVFTGKANDITADAAVLVTAQIPKDEIWNELKAQSNRYNDCGIKSVKVIGDAQAPGPIAWATYAGHRYAQELDEPDIGDALPFKREVAGLLN